jgi:hypothetical protein
LQFKSILVGFAQDQGRKALSDEASLLSRCHQGATAKNNKAPLPARWHHSLMRCNTKSVQPSGRDAAHPCGRYIELPQCVIFITQIKLVV